MRIGIILVVIYFSGWWLTYGTAFYHECAAPEFTARSCSVSVATLWPFYWLARTSEEALKP